MHSFLLSSIPTCSCNSFPLMKRRVIFLTPYNSFYSPQTKTQTTTSDPTHPQPDLTLALPPCPSLVSIAVTNTTTKNSWGRKALISYAFANHSQSLREVRAETQSREEAGTMEECCLMTCSSMACLTCLAGFFIQPRTTLLRVALCRTTPNHSPWSGPKANQHGGIFSFEAPLSRYLWLMPY